MWLLNALLYGALFLGYGVVVYALAVGVKGLYSRVRAGRNQLAEAYKEWYDINEDERNYYCDVFERIVAEWEDLEFYNVDDIMNAMQSYIDGVRSSRVVK